MNLCGHCNAPTKNIKYCSQSCCNAAKIAATHVKVERNQHTTEYRRRRYLLATREHACAMCRNTMWLGEPIHLVMDHIDGNSSNNDLSNLRLICSNCDSTTPFFKSKNRGNGRARRRQRYSEGKSW